MGGEDPVRSESVPPDLDVNDQVSIVLREYEAIRKQIDQGTTFMQGLIVPVSIALAGTLIGWQGKIPAEFAVLSVAPIVVAVLVVALQAYLWTEYSGLQLVVVEDRVFGITKRPLLTHETELALERRKVGGRFWVRLVLLGGLVYLLGEFFLWSRLASKAFIGVDPVLRNLFWISTFVPVLYAGVLVIRFHFLRTKWVITPLARYLTHVADTERP